MVKLTSLQYNLFPFSLFTIFIIFFNGCNTVHNSSCSDELPVSELLDSLTIFKNSHDKTKHHSGMVLIPSGEYMMGAIPSDNYSREDERPQHKVQIAAFWMDAIEVTNKQFNEFVEATGYVTTAERAGSSLVYVPESKSKGNLYWWKMITHAAWMFPFGQESEAVAKPDYPVVHISWYDAMAYASWAGKRLPTEAEWEYAARGGLTDKTYPWGDENPEDEKRANVFQGKFPAENAKTDGFEFFSPVKSFAPNGYGLYDMSGNVWEWCADRYHSRYYQYCKESNIKTPPGPDKSYTAENRFEELRVIRGGSFMCNKSYCTGYRVSARNKTTPSTSLMNVGFRCVRDSI
ncbi:MAG: formylglycine-generating enzyme family protein [Chitinophagales bacterium]|nr:formylglycine-generating enzyme family protein [Chitinophagales bacterium]